MATWRSSRQRPSCFVRFGDLAAVPSSQTFFPFAVARTARQKRVAAPQPRGTVAGVLAQAGLPCIGQPARPSRRDPFLPFIRQMLETFPMLTASRLFVTVRERGYRRGPDHFHHIIARHRPRLKAEAYLRLRTLPGEQGQVDWGHFDHHTVGRARRPLMAFVMVLSFSRQIYLRFFLNARMENLLRGHAGAFTAWGELPRVLLYDNLKSVVLERHGDAIRVHPARLEFTARYRFEPRPVRATRYIRDSFLPTANSSISTTSMPKRRRGATAWQRIGAARTNQP
jgi:hypothetical protein